MNKLDSSKDGAKKPKKSSSKQQQEQQQQDFSRSTEEQPGVSGNRLNMSAITGQNTG